MLLSFALIGCATTQNIYVDGLPISNHEYTASTPEGVKTSFSLTRYYNKKFDDETMIYPEYLDIWDAENRIDINDTEDLILHIKVVNIERIPVSVWSTISGVSTKSSVILYKGKLPRKDLSLQLPLAERGKHKFEVVIVGNKEELFSVWGEYNVEGGAN
jgi:hypothetical protein